MSALLTPLGLLLPDIKPLPLLGPPEARHRVGQCYELEAFQDSPGSYCGHPLCEAGEASGAIFMRDSRSGWHWLEYDSAPPKEVQEVLFQAGWRCSYKRSDDGRNVWRRNERFALPPDSVPYVYAGYCDYSAERPDRLAERAEKKGALAADLHRRSNALVEHIPFGEPIKVGHHSEKRHRRTLARARALTFAACDVSDYASSLSQRAESSAAHHAHQDSAPGLTRRIKTLEADERKFLREEAQWSRSEAGRVRWEFLLFTTREDLAAARAKLAALGPQAEDLGGAQPGDVAIVKGWRVLVLKVNPKSYGCMILNRGPAGMTHNYPKTELRRVLRKGAVPASEAKRMSGLRLPELRTWLRENAELVAVSAEATTEPSAEALA